MGNIALGKTSSAFVIKDMAGVRLKVACFSDIDQVSFESNNKIPPAVGLSPRRGYPITHSL